MSPFDGMHDSPRLLLVGCGNMGGALLSCWIAKFPAWSFSVISPTPVPDEIAAHTDVYKAASEVLSSGEAVFDVIVLAVKPDVIASVCKTVEGLYGDQTLFISIAAGKTVDEIAQSLPYRQPLIRVMPNTPAQIGKAASVGFTGPFVSSEHKDAAEALFTAAGTFDWLTHENLFDAVTAVSGSGPAYVFYLIEALEQAALAEGLPPELSASLARQTLVGAAALADHQEDLPAASLREAVTSPGGTTEAGLKVLMDGRFEKILKETVKAATARGKAL